MKNLLHIFTLLFSTVVFTFSSYADWTKVGKNVIGSIQYVDFESIRKKDGYVYWWELYDYLRPKKSGIFSAKVFVQGDCKQFRYKNLSYSLHKEPMGGGVGEIPTISKQHKVWRHPSPNSIGELTLKSVCSK